MSSYHTSMVSFPSPPEHNSRPLSCDGDSWTSYIGHLDLCSLRIISHRLNFNQHLRKRELLHSHRRPDWPIFREPSLQILLHPSQCISLKIWMVRVDAIHLLNTLTTSLLEDKIDVPERLLDLSFQVCRKRKCWRRDCRVPCACVDQLEDTKILTVDLPWPEISILSPTRTAWL